MNTTSITALPRDWRDRAACGPADTGLLFGEPQDQEDAVRRICWARQCPVITECGAAGIGEWGVWGARTDTARRVDRCGTVAGKSAHRRRNEPVCDACAAAFVAYQRERAAEARAAKAAAAAAVSEGAGTSAA